MQARACAFIAFAAVACAAPKPPPAKPAAAQVVADDATQPSSASMWHHFWDVALARDAVIGGSVQHARAPMLRLAGSEMEEPVPADWLPWIREMRHDAGRAAQADSLQDMAKLVTSVSAQCADCHRTTRGGPEVHVDTMEYGHPDRGLRGTMARHAWAADELWLGMTAPSYSAWMRGADALGEFPVPGLEHVEARPTHGGASSAGRDAAGEAAVEPMVDAAMVERLRAVRALGREAQASRRPFEQVAVFARLIVLCGDCHRSRASGPQHARLTD